ncbi:MAG: phosphoribosylamine--glycine ligase [Chloroflexota bacterium]
MEVLVLGSGAREHALAWRLGRDEGVERVRIAPGNGGTPAVADTVPSLDILDPAAVARHAARERYGLVVVGPEAPLAAGVADALRQASVPVFGPSRAAARLESSKAFAKEQLRRADVPTPAGAVFDDLGEALAHARSSDAPPVVKADWLAAGKGVVVPDTHDAAATAIRELFDNAPQGARVLLEERMDGREVSVFALVSDESVVPLGAACDYKRLRDGDQGPNTGGMGAYAPVPWFGRAEVEQAVATIFEPIAWRMVRDGTPFRGVLYAGLMLTEAGPMVLEFNVRFGDPEAQVLLPLLDGDLARALHGVAVGDRGAIEGSLAMRAGAAVAVVVASEGYPEAAVLGRTLTGGEPSGADDAGPTLRFHAGTVAAGSGYLSSGGRVLTVVGLGPDLGAARAEAYRGVAGIDFDGSQHRTDIALREAIT